MAKWLGVVLRQKKSSLVRQTILQVATQAVATGRRRAGCILQEAPKFRDVDELIELAQDEVEWNKRVKALCPKVKLSKQRKSKRTQSYNVKVRFSNNKD